MSPAKMSMPVIDSRIDAYIARSKPFAQPILWHLRELVHTGCPGVVETVKWSHPFFLCGGVILGNMAAFKEHCSFGFQGREMADVLREENLLRSDAMGSLGRLRTIGDLPPKKKMVALVWQAVALIESGKHTSPMAARNKAKKEVE